MKRAIRLSGPFENLTTEEFNARQDAAMTEAALQSQVVALAKRCGYWVYHTRVSIGSQRGFPDLVLVSELEWVVAVQGPRRVIYAELKRQREKPTPAQLDWLQALATAGADAYVWRPADLSSGAIERVLRGVK